MARASSFAAVSSRLIRYMHACKPVLCQTSVAHVVDRYGGGSVSRSWSGVQKMLMMVMEMRFQRQHLFGTMSCPPKLTENEGVGLQTYPISVPVEEAYKLHKAGHRYLDVRTKEEFDEGHVSGAVNIPYLVSHEGGMSKNPLFIEVVASVFGRDDKIIVGCRSGKRSLMAVEELRSTGYSKSTNIESGYLAWPDQE